MKRILAVFFAAILMLTIVFSVFAHDHSGTTANLDVKYEYDEENNRIIVTANVIDIKDKTGISLIEYNVTYNQSNLSLIEHTVGIPEDWKPYVGGEHFEDWSEKRKDGWFLWAIFITEPSVAVKDDNELNLTLVFDVKNKKSSKIEFVNESSANAELELIALNSATINVSFGGDDTPSIEVSNTEPSVPDIPSKEESAPSVSTDVPDNSTNLPEQSIEDVSGSVSTPDIGDSSDGSVKPNNPDEFIPPVLNAPVQSEISEEISTDSDNTSDISGGDGNSNVGIYVSIAVIILVIIGVVIVILVLRNNGKDK